MKLISALLFLFVTTTAQARDIISINDIPESLYSNSEDKENKKKLILLEFSHKPKLTSMYFRCKEMHSQNFKAEKEVNDVKFGLEVVQIHKNFDRCLDQVRRLFPNDLNKIVTMDSIYEASWLDKMQGQFDHLFADATEKGFRVKDCKSFMQIKKPKNFFFHKESYVNARWVDGMCNLYQSVVEYHESK